MAMLTGSTVGVMAAATTAMMTIAIRHCCNNIFGVTSLNLASAKTRIGNSKPIPSQNIRLVEMICDIVEDLDASRKGTLKEKIEFVKDRPGHDRRYAINFNRLKNDLGWIPEESFESGLQKTIQWYMENRSWVDRVKSGEYRSWIKEQYTDSNL